MDHVGITVDDMDSAIAFFLELGLELEGRQTVEGRWLDKVIEIEGSQIDNAMLRTPDGHSKVELSQFLKPPAVREGTASMANVVGIRNMMFAVDDIKDTVARLKKHGGELIGELTQYEQMYLLCYLRGPSGIIVALAEELKQ